MKALMFDMDGTILDSLRGWFYSYKELIKELNLEESPELVTKLKGNRLYDRGRILIEEYNLDYTADEMYKKLLEYIAIGYRKEYLPKENVEEALKYLKGKGYKISLNTASGYERVKDCFERIDFFKYFDFIQTVNQCGFKKEDVKYFEYAIEKHGENAEDIFFFDDIGEPLRTGQKAGVKTVLVYDEFSNGYIFDEVDEFDHKIETISVENMKKLGL